MSGYLCGGGLPLDMFCTCLYVENMAVSKMVQIRHVPAALHRKLKARAAEAGMSLSDYLLAELRRVAERPTLDELVERLKAREPISTAIDSAGLVRAERDGRR